jgi:hypothetical protein
MREVIRRLMTTLYRRFTSLDRSDRRLVLQAATLMALVWTGLRLLRFAALRRILDRYAVSPATGLGRQRDPMAIDRVRWAITAVAGRFPSGTCLAQALAGEVMLRRRGLECELRIGVRASSGSAMPIEAHAWVLCQGAVAIGALDDLSTFQPLTAPGPHGSHDFADRD